MNTTSIRSLARAPLASRPLAVLLAAAVLCATAPGAGASQPKDVPLTSAEALAALDSLAGKWVGTTDHGDPITIDVEARRLSVDVPDAELARRRESFRPRKKDVRSSWLRRYAHLVTNAAKGAVMRTDL